MSLRIGFVILFSMAGMYLSAQTLEALREQIRLFEHEIRINTALLNKTSKEKQVSQSQLKLIQQRISNRRGIVLSLEKQIKLINGDLDAKNRSIAALNAELDQLKKEYGKMVYESYKNYKLNNYLVFLFSSQDFNDASRRVNYMRRYNRMREEKAQQIDSLSLSLSEKITALHHKKAELDQTFHSKNQELAALGKDEVQYKGTVSKLQTTESKLTRDLRTKRDQIANAQKQIQRIIAEESRRSGSKAPRTAAEAEAFTALSGKFDQHMGRLPYPIRGGVIIDRYGVHRHPTQRNLTINNQGVNIAGERGATVHCVFEGVVVRVYFCLGLNNMVLVRHGEYITVYANLASVSVKTGDKVTAGEIVGRIPDTDDSDNCMLHFTIWKEIPNKDPQNLNPELWLRR